MKVEVGGYAFIGPRGGIPHSLKSFRNAGAMLVVGSQRRKSRSLDFKDGAHLEDIAEQTRSLVRSASIRKVAVSLGLTTKCLLPAVTAPRHLNEGQRSLRARHSG